MSWPTRRSDARQVRAAIGDVLLGEGHYPRTWDEAQGDHQRVYTNRVRDLQRDP